MDEWHIFEVYPDVKEIYVVKGIPFIDKAEAKKMGKPEVIKRSNEDA